MNLLFADTETTGLAATDRLCQIGFHINGLEVNALFKPPVMIKSGAMAVHNITNAMVADKRPFQGGAEHMLLSHLQKSVVFVAHNAPFDLKMLEREGLRFERVIDTLKVARHLLSKDTVASHSLQHLRSYYQLETETTAHDAMNDVRVMMGVFDKLMERLLELEGGTPQERVSRMMEITNQ
jgi:DNA polymerase III epsilon subunit-like protein